ncbi:MAG TPA: zinc-binding dehydrogenase [Anaerolineales bacterium]|nr:zinc-binding dehydrogenase [Anaerolineales bacterium]
MNKSMTTGRRTRVTALHCGHLIALGKVRINVNQRFALKDAADAHKALEARATSDSTVLTI